MSKAQIKVLLVDDDQSIRQILGNEIRQMGYLVETAGSIADGRRAFGEFQPDAAILDVRLPDGTGDQLLREAAARNAPHTQFIMLTGHADVELAVSCMRAGAFDFLTKPCSLSHLELTLQRALEHRKLLEQKETLAHGHAPVRAGREIIGASAAIERTRELIRKIAPTGETVLITGESGTGKELVAQALWKHSPRAEESFIAVNCCAVAETLLESELFGHEKGAFSGAERRRSGMFELAHRGTIFLDEIGDMPAAMQSKLLRVLQEGEIRRVGGNETIQIDVRVIAATNRDIEEDSRQGSFRADLLHRINAIVIEVPPLRERRDDLPLLCEQILRNFAASPGGRMVGVAPEVRSLLAQYSWPGNVRELENVIKRMAILAQTDQITINDLPAHIVDLTLPAIAADEKIIPLAELERRHILNTLQQLAGNKTQTARALGITPKTLYNKLEAYGLKSI